MGARKGGARKGGAWKGGGPEGWGPKGGGPKGGTRAQNFAFLFSFSRHNFNYFFFLSGFFSWNFGVLKRRDPQMCSEILGGPAEAVPGESGPGGGRSRGRAVPGEGGPGGGWSRGRAVPGRTKERKKKEKNKMKKK